MSPASPRRSSPSPSPSSPSTPPAPLLHRKRLSVSKLFPPAHISQPSSDPKAHFLEREIENPDLGHARAHGHHVEADWAAVRGPGQVDDGKKSGRMRAISTVSGDLRAPCGKFKAEEKCSKCEGVVDEYSSDLCGFGSTVTNPCTYPVWYTRTTNGRKPSEYNRANFV